MAAKEMIWIRYLHKKGILKKGLVNFEENEKEKKEFMQMLYRLKKRKIKDGIRTIDERVNKINKE